MADHIKALKNAFRATKKFFRKIKFWPRKMQKTDFLVNFTGFSQISENIIIWKWCHWNHWIERQKCLKYHPKIFQLCGVLTFMKFCIYYKNHKIKNVVQTENTHLNKISVSKLTKKSVKMLKLRNLGMFFPIPNLQSQARAHLGEFTSH